MASLDELPPQLGVPKLDKTTAALLAALVATDILSRDPGAHKLGPNIRAYYE